MKLFFLGLLKTQIVQAVDWFWSTCVLVNTFSNALFTLSLLPAVAHLLTKNFTVFAVEVMQIIHTFMFTALSVHCCTIVFKFTAEYLVFSQRCHIYSKAWARCTGCALGGFYLSSASGNADS